MSPPRPTLATLPLRPGFRLRTADAALSLEALVTHAHALAPTLPDAPVLEVPARDPYAALTHIEACFSRGIIPVPSSTSTPTPFACVPDLPAELALRTSGSSGEPRLPAFTFAALTLSAQRIAGYLALTDRDEIALLQPLVHGFGLVGQLFAAIAAGAAVTDCARPYPDERAAAVAAAGATVVAAVPHTLQHLAEHLAEHDPHACANIRSIGSAGSRLPPTLARRLALAFPNAVIWNQYGCTEAGPRLTAVPSNHIAFYTGTVGRAIEGVSLWIGDPETADVLPAGRPGEINFVSDMQMLGYLGDPEATERQRRPLGNAQGFWTGDLGVLDPDDRVHVLGRGDDLVKIRGERVSLYALARAAENAGARAAIAVLPDTDGPDEGRLTLVYEAEHELTATALARALPAQNRMLPRRMLWLPNLPRLASGKVDRSAVELLAELASASPRRPER